MTGMALNVKGKEDFLREHRVDFLVVGGGLAGTAAAITAARCGLKTALVQNRPVLGGPAGSECDSAADGSIVGGASQYLNRNARETGIIEEWKQEAAYRLANGWRNHWSLVMREWCEREPNLTLLLNTEAYQVEMDGARIKAVTARTLGSELTHHISAPLFADCSGDSFLGFAAGAEFRMGREGRAEFGESQAPERADNKTMGSSLFFRAVDVGHPVPFLPPSWACRFESDADLPYRNHDNIAEGYWWLECGGELDTIADNEAIYRKLLSVLYGLWDHIKNRGDHGAANYAINWVAAIPGKRESRRLMGDYILTQNDLLKKPDFPDTVAYGGWHIDQHPIAGIFSKLHPCQAGDLILPGRYPIPFRCLYSRNVENLLMAGRNISASHVALGSTRVMATCALLGQAVGAAASLIEKRQTTPRGIVGHHMDELLTVLHGLDHVLVDTPVPTPGNVAKKATAAASSSMTLKMMASTAVEALSQPAGELCGQMFNVSSDRLESVTVKMNNRGGSPRPVTARLGHAVQAEVFPAQAGLAAATAMVEPGLGIDVRFDFNVNTTPGKLYFVQLSSEPELEVCLNHAYYPGLYHKLSARLNFCLEVIPEQRLFPPESVLDDYARAGERPHLWISDPEEPLPQQVTLSFPEPERCVAAELVFDTNLDFMQKEGAAPQCVRDYRLEGRVDGAWRILAAEAGNHHRFRRHAFPAVEIDAARLVITATNGDNAARVYQLRLIGEGKPQAE